MDLAAHCELCDHQLTTLKFGTTCGLTERKPEFNITCMKIELHDKFEKKLKLVNIEYENLKRRKLLTYIFFTFFLCVGIGVIIGGFLFGKYIWDHGVISAGPIIIMGVGLGPLGMAFGALNKHLQEIRVAKHRKDRVDEVLKVYRIQYDINIEFGKKIHFQQEVFTDLKIRRVW